MFPLVRQSTLVISTPVQPLFNVLFRKQKFPDEDTSTISDFIELSVDSFVRNVTSQRQLSGDFFTIMRFNTCQSLSESFEVLLK